MVGVDDDGFVDFFLVCEWVFNWLFYKIVYLIVFDFLFFFMNEWVFRVFMLGEG